MSDHAFSILVPNNSATDARSLADSLCQQIRDQLFDIQGHTLKLTFSIGICPLGDGSSDPAQVLTDAKGAADRVESGDGVKLFNRAIQTAGSEQDVALLEKIQEAFDSGRLQLMYQPIVKLHGEERSLYQVLLRVSDEKGKMLDSSQVFSTAKAAGLAEKLDRWIIKEAMKSLKAQKVEPGTQLFVSLSGASLIDTGLVPYINGLMTKAGLDKNSLTFQVDQDDAINHLKRVIALAAELKSNGYSLCLANFGNDKEQTVLIDQLDVDYVKISEEMASKMHQEPEIAEQISNALGEIHRHDKDSIIPRVEEAAMLAALWPMNVRYIQGYYLQRPNLKMDYDFSASGF